MCTKCKICGEDEFESVPCGSFTDASCKKEVAAKSKTDKGTITLKNLRLGGMLPVRTTAKDIAVQVAVGLADFQTNLATKVFSNLDPSLKN